MDYLASLEEDFPQLFDDEDHDTQKQKNRKKAKLKLTKLPQNIDGEQLLNQESSENLYGQLQFQDQVLQMGSESDTQLDQDNVPFTLLFNKNQRSMQKDSKNAKSNRSDVRQDKNNQPQIKKQVVQDNQSPIQYGKLQEVQDLDLLPFNKLIEHKNTTAQVQDSKSNIHKQKAQKEQVARAQHRERGKNLIRDVKVPQRFQQSINAPGDNVLNKAEMNQTLNEKRSKRKSQNLANQTKDEQNYTNVIIVQQEETSSDSEQPLFSIYQQKSQPKQGLKNNFTKQESQEQNAINNGNNATDKKLNDLVAIPIEGTPKQRLRFIQTIKNNPSNEVQNEQSRQDNTVSQYQEQLDFKQNQTKPQESSQNISTPKLTNNKDSAQNADKRFQRPQDKISFAQQQLKSHKGVQLDSNNDQGNSQLKANLPAQQNRSDLAQQSKSSSQQVKINIQQLQDRMSARRPQRRTVYGIQRESRTPEKINEAKVLQNQSPQINDKPGQRNASSKEPELKIDLNSESKQSSQLTTPNQPQKKILRLISTQQKVDKNLANTQIQNYSQTLNTSTNLQLQNEQISPPQIDSKQQNANQSGSLYQERQRIAEIGSISGKDITQKFVQIQIQLGYQSQLQWKYKYPLLLEPYGNGDSCKSQFEKLQKEFSGIQFIQQQS